MIEIIEGRGVGSGKSFYALTRIVQMLASGGSIWATDTFGLNWEETALLVADRFGIEIEETQYTTFKRESTRDLHEMVPQGTADCPVLVVLDECHMELNARDWSDKNRRGFFDWLTQSRHDDVDVIFISQNALNIDTQVRRLVTYICRCRNMMNFEIPLFGKWPMKQFAVNRFDSDGRTLMKRVWLKHDRELFKCYNSKIMRGAHRRISMEVSRKNLKKSSVTKRSKNMGKWILIVSLVIGVLGLYTLWTIKDRREFDAIRKPSDTKAQGPIAKAAEALVSPERYKIYDEDFRAWNGPDALLRTVDGEYQVGEMSNKGFVIAASQQRARVLRPDGGSAWVVARVKDHPNAKQAPQATPSPQSTPIPAKESEKIATTRKRTKAMDMYRVQAGLAPTPEEQDAIYDRQAGNPAQE